MGKSKITLGLRMGQAIAALEDAKGNQIFTGVRMVAPGEDLEPRVVPTGIDGLDMAIGVGGLPEGRFIILHGAEGTGKSTLALEMVAQVQRMGGVCLYIDWECKLDLAYAAAIGVDVHSLILATPEHIEKGFGLVAKVLEITRKVDADCPVLIVWDSLHAAMAMKEANADFDQGVFSPEPQSYSRGLKKIIPRLALARAILVGISQVRMTTDGMHSKEVVAVGKAAPFYASVIMEVKNETPRGTVKTGRTGEKIRVICRKNQVAAPFRVTHLDIVYGSGIDRVAATCDAAWALGVVSKHGQKVCLGDVDLYTGKKEEFAEWAKANPDLLEKIREAVHQAMIRGDAPVVQDLRPEECVPLDNLDTPAGDQPSRRGSGRGKDRE